jgi:hypothetical protein
LNGRLMLDLPGRHHKIQQHRLSKIQIITP